MTISHCFAVCCMCENMIFPTLSSLVKTAIMSTDRELSLVIDSEFIQVSNIQCIYITKAADTLLLSSAAEEKERLHRAMRSCFWIKLNLSCLLFISYSALCHSPPHISVYAQCWFCPHGNQSGPSNQCLGEQTYLGRRSGNGEKGRSKKKEARERKREKNGDQIQRTLKTQQQKICLSGKASPALQP